MLLWLTELLSREVRTFNVFGYISLRAVLATMNALVISFRNGPRLSAGPTKMRNGQGVGGKGPGKHVAEPGGPAPGVTAW